MLMLTTFNPSTIDYNQWHIYHYSKQTVPQAADNLSCGAEHVVYLVTLAEVMM